MGTYTAIFTAVGSVLALWSITWIIRASLSNPDTREAEVEARARVARGEGWDGPTAPHTFSDEEMADLAQALAPLTLEEAGVDARPRTHESPKWRQRLRGTRAS